MCAVHESNSCTKLYKSNYIHRSLKAYHGLHAELHVRKQTRETVFHRDIQTPKRELKIRRAAEYFDKIRGVWTADETLSPVTTHSKQ